MIALTVNGARVTAEVEPRTLLADFLRDELHLTGTHIGCAQGVCGACTLLVEGRPQRSCLTFAIACDEARITTIEGFDDDEVMAALREAFSAHHALQCGFCTPGMLATARDIVLRLGDVPDARIREELAGNLCRCTGYVGIVEAVRAVCAGRSPCAAAMPIAPTPETTPVAAPAAPLPPAAAPVSGGGTSLEQSIAVRAAPQDVWAALCDLRRVAACLPGAEIDGIDGDRLTGRMTVALGPIRAAFRGTATVTTDDATRTGRLVGRGRDGGSAAEGTLGWQVVPDGDGSRIRLTLTWRLTGALAQFARAGLVRDIVQRLASTAAANLEASLTGAAPPPPARPLGLLALLWSALVRCLTRRDA